MLSKAWGLIFLLWVVLLVSKNVISAPFCEKESSFCTDLLKEKTYIVKTGNFLKGGVVIPIPDELKPTLIVSPTSVIVEGQNLTLYLGVESLTQFSYIGKNFEAGTKYSFKESKSVVEAVSASVAGGELEGEFLKLLESDIEVDAAPEEITITADVVNTGGSGTSSIYRAIFELEEKQLIPSYTYILSNYMVDSAPTSTYQKDSQPVYGMLTKISSTELKFNFAFDGVNVLTYNVNSVNENEKSKTYSVTYVNIDKLVNASPLSGTLSFDEKLKDVFSTTVSIELSSISISFTSQSKNSVLNFLALEIDKLQPEQPDCSAYVNNSSLTYPEVCFNCSCSEFCPCPKLPIQEAPIETTLLESVPVQPDLGIIITWENHTKLNIGIYFQMEASDKIYLQSTEFGGVSELCYVVLNGDAKSLEAVKINNFSCFSDKVNHLKAILEQSAYLKVNQNKKSFSLFSENSNNKIVTNSSVEFSLIDMKFETKSKINVESFIPVKLYFIPSESSYSFQQELQNLFTTGILSFKFHEVENNDVIHFELSDKDSKIFFSVLALVDSSTNKIKDVIEIKVADSNIDEAISNEIKQILFNDNVEVTFLDRKISFHQASSDVVFSVGEQAYPIISKDWAIVLDVLSIKNQAVFKIYALDTDTPIVIDTITITFLKNEKFLVVKDVDIENQSAKLSELTSKDKILKAVVDALTTAIEFELQPVSTVVNSVNSNLLKIIVHGGKAVVSLTYDLSNYDASIHADNKILSASYIGSISEIFNEAGQVIQLGEKLPIHLLYTGSKIEVALFLDNTYFYSYNLGNDLYTVKKTEKQSQLYSLSAANNKTLPYLTGIQKMFDSLYAISVVDSSVTFKTKQNQAISLQIDKKLLNIIQPKKGINQINSFQGVEIIEVNKHTVHDGCSLNFIFKVEGTKAKWISIRCITKENNLINAYFISNAAKGYVTVYPSIKNNNFIETFKNCTHVTIGLKSLKFDCINAFVVATSNQIITNSGAPLKFNIYFADNEASNLTKKLNQRLLLTQNNFDKNVSNYVKETIKQNFPGIHFTLKDVKNVFKLINLLTWHNPADFVGHLIPCLTNDTPECNETQELSEVFVDSIFEYLAGFPEFRTFVFQWVFDNLKQSKPQPVYLESAPAFKPQGTDELGYDINSIKNMFAHIEKVVGTDPIPYIKNKFPHLLSELLDKKPNEIISVPFLVEVLEYLKKLPIFSGWNLNWLPEPNTTDTSTFWEKVSEDFKIDKNSLSGFIYKNQYSLLFVKDLLQSIKNITGFDPFKYLESIKPSLLKLSNLSHKELAETFLSTEELEQILSEVGKIDQFKNLGLQYWLPKNPYAPLDVSLNGLMYPKDTIKSENITNTKDSNSKNQDVAPTQDNIFQSVNSLFNIFGDGVKMIENIFPWVSSEQKNKPDEKSFMYSKNNRMLDSNCLKCGKNEEENNKYAHINSFKYRFNQEKASESVSEDNTNPKQSKTKEVYVLKYSDSIGSDDISIVTKEKIHIHMNSKARMLAVADLENTVEFFAMYSPNFYHATYYVPNVMDRPTYFQAFRCEDEKTCVTFYGQKYVYYYVITHGEPNGKVYDVKIVGKMLSQSPNNATVPDDVDDFVKNMLKNVTFVIKTNHGLKLVIAIDGSDEQKTSHVYAKYELIPSTVKSFGNNIYSYGEQYPIFLTVSQNLNGMAKMAVHGKKIHTFVISFLNTDGWVLNSKFIGDLNPNNYGLVNTLEDTIVKTLNEVNQLSFEKDGTLQLFVYNLPRVQHKLSATFKKIDNPFDFSLYVDLGHKKLKPETYKDNIDFKSILGGENIEIHIKQPYLGGILVTYAGIAMNFTVFHDYQNSDGWVEFSVLIGNSVDINKQMYTPTTLLATDENLKDLLVKPQQISFEKDGQVQFIRDFSGKSVVVFQ